MPLQRALDQKPGFAFRNQGDARQVLAGSANVLQAEYEVPFLAHAPLEPMNATALVRDGRVTVWAPTQVVVVGGLAIAKVGYDKYLRFLWPLLVAMFVVTSVILAIAASVG